MLATLSLIIKIGKILWDIEPTLYSAFMAILAAIKPTPTTGNADTTEVVKSVARAFIPVVDAGNQVKLQEALTSYDENFANNPQLFGGA